MINEDAKTQGISGRRDKRIIEDKSGRLGETRNYSPVNGNEEQSGSVASHCTRGNSPRTNFVYGDATTGKMLKRLDQLEEAHYQYVHAHQNRLRARLDESEKLEEDFRKQAAEMRNEILALASQGEQTEETE